MKVKKTVLSNVIFIGLGLLLLLFFYFLYRQIDLLNESSDAVNVTHIVKLKLEQNLTALKDAETSQRGFLLTEDSLFLSPYEEATVRFHRTLDELDSLLRDN